jgi:hypothetical protein
MENQRFNFSRYFGDLPDPRRDNGQLRHELVDILAIALCGVMSGAESFVKLKSMASAKKRGCASDWDCLFCMGFPATTPLVVFSLGLTHLLLKHVLWRGHKPCTRSRRAKSLH